MKTSSLLPKLWKTDEDKGFMQLQQAMNDLFENFNLSSDLPLKAWSGNAKGVEWSPRLDVAETDKEIMVTAELPGIDEKDVDVSLSGDYLVIKGEKRYENVEKGKTFHHVERTWGSFQRMLPLSCEVDRNNVKAIFSKGVLSVTLAKSPKAQESVRKIPVKAG